MPGEHDSGQRRAAARSTFRYVAAVVAMIVVSGAMVSSAALFPRPGEQVAVLFPPWVSEPEATARVWRAGGYALSTEGLGVVAVGEAGDFISNLFEAGAVLVVDASAAAALCGAGLRRNAT